MHSDPDLLSPQTGEKASCLSENTFQVLHPLSWVDVAVVSEKGLRLAVVEPFCKSAIIDTLTVKPERGFVVLVLRNILI